MLRGSAIALVAFLLYFTGLGTVPLIDPDEGRYAEIAREMLATGDFVTPHVNGVVYLEKPPLYYWMEAGALALLGRSEVAARLCSAVFGLAAVALACVLGRSMGGRRAGPKAALILGTSPLYLVLSRLNIIDMTLTFFLTATMVCFWLAHERPPDRRAALLWYGMFAAAAFAVLTKGLIGMVIPGAVIFAYLAATRRWNVLRIVPWTGGILLFLGIAAPWHILVARRNPGFLEFYFLHEHLLRFTSPVAHHEQPIWFFLPVVVLGMLPWSGLLPAAARLYRSARDGGGDRRRSALIFLASWGGFVLAFFSLSHSKLIPYILPACVPLALLVALVVQGAWTSRIPRSGRIGLVLSHLAILGMGIAFIVAGCGRIPRFSDPGFLSLPLIAAGSLTCAVSAIGLILIDRGKPRPFLASAGLSAMLLFACIWLAGPQIGAGRSTRRFAGLLQDHLRGDEALFTFRTYPQSLPFYLDRLVGIADWSGELTPGLERLPESERTARFPSRPAVRRRWQSEEATFLVVDRRHVRDLRRLGPRRGRVLLEEPRFMLLTNQPTEAEARRSRGDGSPAGAGR